MPRPTFHNLPASKRTRIVRAAIAEFAAHPYREASLDRVAAAAGVSKGSLYQYFDDKADLHRYLVAQELGARKAAAVPVAEGRTFFEQLEATFFSGLEAFRSDPQIAALGASLLRDTSEPEVRALTKAALEAGTAHFRRALADAQVRGEVRADLDLDVGARIVAAVAGPILLDVLEARLGADLATLARPARRGAPRAIDDALLRSTVRAVLDVLARGLGAPTQPPARRATSARRSAR